MNPAKKNENVTTTSGIGSSGGARTRPSTGIP